MCPGSRRRRPCPSPGSASTAAVSAPGPARRRRAGGQRPHDRKRQASSSPLRSPCRHICARDNPRCRSATPRAPRSEERRVGKEVSVRVDLGGRRIIKKKKKKKQTDERYTEITRKKTINKTKQHTIT